MALGRGGMKGLELAERYYEEYGRPLWPSISRPYQDRIAAGLVGEGSECFGFDDELSRDHDWGPGFCLWLTADDYAEIGARAAGALRRAAEELRAVSRRRLEGPHAGKRTGVFEITDFYRRFVRYDHVPATLAEWRAASRDLSGHGHQRAGCSPIRWASSPRSAQGLLAFYPEDVRLQEAGRPLRRGRPGRAIQLRQVRRPG